MSLMGSSRLPRSRSRLVMAVLRSLRCGRSSDVGNGASLALSRRAAGLAVLRSRRADAPGGDAAAGGPDRFGESVEHRLRAEFVVERVAMDAEGLRCLRDVAPAGRHRRDDVLPFERLDRLLERDAVANQFTNDLVQTIIDTDHRFCP